MKKKKDVRGSGEGGGNEGMDRLNKWCGKNGQRAGQTDRGKVGKGEGGGGVNSLRLDWMKKEEEEEEKLLRLKSCHC